MVTNGSCMHIRLSFLHLDAFPAASCIYLSYNPHTFVSVILESELGNFSDVLHDSASVTMAGKGKRPPSSPYLSGFGTRQGVPFGGTGSFAGSILSGSV